MEKIFNAVSKDISGEGKVNGCRWSYSPTNNPAACGVLSFASNECFDRWANSRIIEVNTVLWDVHDPDFEQFVHGIVKLFVW